jgi:hypothetical protein
MPFDILHSFKGVDSYGLVPLVLYRVENRLDRFR